jgi:hypothetical protein
MLQDVTGMPQSLYKRANINIFLMGVPADGSKFFNRDGIVGSYQRGSFVSQLVLQFNNNCIYFNFGKMVN